MTSIIKHAKNFVEYMNSLNDLKTIKAHCNDLALEQRRESNNASTLKSRFTRIRKIIKEQLNLKPDVKNQIEVEFALNRPTDSTINFFEEDFAKSYIGNYFTLTKPELEDYRNLSQEQTDKGMIDLMVLKLSDVELIKQISVINLFSPYYSHRLLALVFLTGRRPVELAKTGNMSVVSKNTIFFDGWAKNKSDKDGETLPVLYDADEIVRSFLGLREMRDYSEKTKEQVHDIVSTTMSKSFKTVYKIFSDLSQKNQAFANIRPYQLRGLYAEYFCWLEDNGGLNWYKVKTGKDNVHHIIKKQYILGHDLRKTQENYNDFKIVR